MKKCISSSIFILNNDTKKYNDKYFSFVLFILIYGNDFLNCF